MRISKNGLGDFGKNFHVKGRMNGLVKLPSRAMNGTVVLPRGMAGTVVIPSGRFSGTVVLPRGKNMNGTVVLPRGRGFGSWLSDLTGINASVDPAAAAQGAVTGQLNQLLSQPGVQTAAAGVAQQSAASSLGTWIINNPMYIVGGIAAIGGIAYLLAKK